MELYYKFSPLLMQYTPKETVYAWMQQTKSLDPKQLIPALVQYDHLKYREQVTERPDTEHHQPAEVAYSLKRVLSGVWPPSHP